MSRRFNPMWAKAPALLLRFPGLFIAVAVGAMLLALTISSFPVFVSSSETATLSEAIAEANRFGAGVTVIQGDALRPQHGFTEQYEEFTGLDAGEDAPPTWEQRTALLEKGLGNVEHLGDVIVTVLGPNVDMAALPEQGGRDFQVHLIDRTGWQNHVKVIDRVDAEGIWIADTVAQQIRVEAGDDIILRSSEGERRVPVEAVYEALEKTPQAAPFWAGLGNEIFPPAPGLTTPPPFAFLPARELADISRELGSPDAQFRWEYPIEIRDGLTLPQAESLWADLEVFRQDFSDGDSKLGRAFFCLTPAFCTSGSGLVNFGSLLGPIIRETNQTIDAISGPIDLLSDAGVLVALAVIASAGTFTIARRQIEASLLFARGSSALSVGIKTALESILPAAVGTVAGIALGLGVVSWLGPGDIDQSARTEAIRTAILSMPVAIALVGLVAAIAFIRQSETASHRFRLLAAFPWELLVLAVAGLCLRNLLQGEALIEEGANEVSRPSVYLLLFPIFFIAGFGGLAARALRTPLKGLIDSPRLGRFAPYLAFHRLAGAKRLAVLLVTACALALGVLVYAQGVATSLDMTIVAKSKLFIGSDVQGQVLYELEIPDNLAFPATKVTHIPQRTTLDGNTDVQVSVIGIDAPTFADAAYWESSFSDQPIEDLLDALRDGDGSRLPVIMVNSDRDASLATIAGTELPVEVIGRADFFPGATESRPTLIADTETFHEFADENGNGLNPLLDPGNNSELWIKGDPDAIIRDLGEKSAPVFTTVTAEQVQENPSIVAVTRTFAYLEFLGLGAGLLAVVAILMYLQARQRSRTVSYALSRRMGLSRTSHKVALLIELGWMLFSAFAVAALLALIAAAVVLPEIEPLPNIPPATLYRTPTLLLLAAAAALGLTTLLGGLLADRTSENVNFAEVMRVAG